MQQCQKCFTVLRDEEGNPICDKRIKYCSICGPVVEKEKQSEYGKNAYKKRLDAMTPEQKEEFYAERRRYAAWYRNKHKQRCFNCFRLLRNKRGRQLKDKRIKYCHICRPIIEQQKKLAREQRYRDKHQKEIRKKHKKWCRAHPEQRRLISRNYVYNHPEEHRQHLNSWRRRNPDKVSLQNKRAKVNFRRRKGRTLHGNGIYAKIKWPVVCPKCSREFETSAKRPRCTCGYPFTRRFMEKFIDNAQTTPCKCCGREIPHPDKAVGRPREYCECCFPQIQAIKKAFGMRPTDNRKWYRNNVEIVVAVTCIFCDEILPGHGGKKVCRKCQFKWQSTTPRKIVTALANCSSFKRLSRDLLAWKRIIEYRAHGVYSLR